MTEQYRSRRFEEEARIQAYLARLPTDKIGITVSQATGHMSENNTRFDEALLDYVNQADINPDAVEKYTKPLEDYYEQFNAVASAIDDGPPGHRPLPEGVTYLDEGFFFYAYLYQDPSGAKHVIKVPQGHSFGSRARTFIGTAIALVRSKGNDALEQVEGLSLTEKLRIVTRYEDGPWFATLSTEQLAKIPREHVQKLAADLKDSARRNVAADMHGKGNLRYNPDKGFILLDPHSAAEYRVDKFQNTRSVSNIIQHLLHDTPPGDAQSAALRLSIAEELLRSVGPDFADLADMPGLLSPLSRRAGDAIPPPWPPAKTSLPDTSAGREAQTRHTASTTGTTAAYGDSVLLRTGTVIAEQVQSLPLARLQQAAEHLAAALDISSAVDASAQVGFNTHLMGSQQHLERAVAEFTNAREQFNIYLASIGLKRLTYPTE